MTCEKCRLDATIQKMNLEWKNIAPMDIEPGEGHDGCKGCTCQHLPVGSVEFLGSDPSRSV